MRTPRQRVYTKVNRIRLKYRPEPLHQSYAAVQYRFEAGRGRIQAALKRSEAMWDINLI